MRQRRLRGTTRELDQQARALRREMTEAEAVLWRALRRHKVDGLTFRRQHPVERFILDFACVRKKLCIEVDGGVHDGQVEYDAERTAALEALGWRVLRFRNEEVFGKLHLVMHRVRATLDDIG